MAAGAGSNGREASYIARTADIRGAAGIIPPGRRAVAASFSDAAESRVCCTDSDRRILFIEHELKECVMILVTGATGNIGKELVSQLLAEKGQQLRVVSRDERKLLNLDPDVERLIGDLRERTTVERAVRGVDQLFLVWSLVDESHDAD